MMYLRKSNIDVMFFYLRPVDGTFGLCQMPRWFCQMLGGYQAAMLRPLPSVDEQGSGGLHVARQGND